MNGDYNEVTHSLRFHNMSITECYQKVRKTQSILSMKNMKNQNVRPRKVGIESGGQHGNISVQIRDYKNERGYISVPTHIWRSLSQKQKHLVVTYNKEVGTTKRKSLAREDRNDGTIKRLRRTVREIMDEDRDKSEVREDTNPDKGKNDRQDEINVPKFTFNIK